MGERGLHDSGKEGGQQGNDSVADLQLGQEFQSVGTHVVCPEARFSSRLAPTTTRVRVLLRPRASHPVNANLQGAVIAIKNIPCALPRRDSGLPGPCRYAPYGSSALCLQHNRASGSRGVKKQARKSTAGGGPHCCATTRTTLRASLTSRCHRAGLRQRGSAGRQPCRPRPRG